MATLIRIELMSNQAELEIKTSGAEPRKFRVLGQDHVLVELEKTDDEIKVILKKATPPLVKDLNPGSPDDDMEPLPPSGRAGVTVVMSDGREFYQGRPKPKGKR